MSDPKLEEIKERYAKGFQPDELMFARVVAVDVRRLVAEVERLQAERFAPVGDNHHNAAACPYCSRDSRLPEKEVGQ